MRKGKKNDEHSLNSTKRESRKEFIKFTQRVTLTIHAPE